jgi:uncharacterized protein YndB with AHSA1/START domain
MSTQATTKAVRRSVTVNRPVEDAFRLFTEGISTWWPLDSHSIGKEGVDPEAAVLEGREGGRLYERMADGDTSHWGTVLVWEPPTRVVISWELKPQRPATEVEVRFSAAGDATRVDLEHRGWERLGAEAEDARAGYHSGWEFVLGRYADAASRAA